MLGGTGLARVELADKLADRPWALEEKIQNAAARWLGDHVEDRRHGIIIPHRLYN